MIHYYLSESENMQEAQQKIESVEHGIKPFRQYLQQAIESVKNQKVSAGWEMADIYNATITMRGTLYKCEFKSIVSIDEACFAELQKYYVIENFPALPDSDEKLIITLSNSNKIKIEPECIAYNRFIPKSDIDLNHVIKASWSGEDIRLQSVDEWLKSGISFVNINSDKAIFETKDSLSAKIFHIKSIESNRIEVDGNVGLTSNVFITKDNIALKVCVQIPKMPENSIHIQGDIFYISSPNGQIENALSAHEAKQYYSYDTLRIHNEKIDIESHDDNKIYIKNVKTILQKSSVIAKDYRGIEYEIREYQTKSYTIRLIADDSDSDDANSSLRHFYEPEMAVRVTLENGKKETCSIYIKDKDENLIELKCKGRLVLPKENTKIITEPNAYQLRCQLFAIDTLIERPIKEQHVFINLFRDFNQVSFHQDSPALQIDYEIEELKGNGSPEHKEFVQKALSTKDFAILEGPPGSGKTTAILELICQIVKRGRRILLCGSTHVAIDNVLERLKQRGLIERFNILPIRVGSDGAISDDVKEYRLGKIDDDGNVIERDFDGSLMEKYSIGESDGMSLDSFLDIANLVCGTTIGILQYPRFKPIDDEKSKRKKTRFMFPEFDYLIIDECSKTTFQEFLVPAMYAKKWILIGDTKQLSPFVERSLMEANLANLPIGKDETLDIALQRACLLLFNYRTIYGDVKDITNKDIVVAFAIPSGIFYHIKEEIKARWEKDNNSKLRIGILDSKEYLQNDRSHYSDKDSYFGMGRYATNIKLEFILSYDVVFFDSEDSSVWDSMPECVFVFESNPSPRAIGQMYNFTYYTQPSDKQHDNIIKVQDKWQTYFKDNSWASEVCWRLNREFESRLFDNAKHDRNSYINKINALLPRSQNIHIIKNKIGTIANIAQPSVLQSLICGVQDRYSDKSNTIRKGFKKEDLASRHVILKNQYRMHPYISHFPREQFYRGNALQDGANLKKNREWDYKRYDRRAVWLDVAGRSYRGRNEREADKLMEELKSFLSFAEQNPHNTQGQIWSIAVLSFYQGQRMLLEEKLQKLTKSKRSSNFIWHGRGDVAIPIKLGTVDRFQGQEADIVFLSMVRTDKVGFLDNPNRINVAITRAKYQLVILGDARFFRCCENDMLENLLKATKEK